MQVELFSGNRVALYPFCTDDYNDGVYRNTRQNALEKCLIQVNPCQAQYRLVFDLDLSRDKSRYAWEDNHVAPPNWLAINRKNGHAHYSYELATSVANNNPLAREHPMRYMAAIQDAYTRKLGSDPSYRHILCKNPHNATWEVEQLRLEPYDLGEMAEYVELRKRPPSRKEAIGYSRNVSLHYALCSKAGSLVRQYWARALEISKDLFSSFSREIHAIAFSLNFFDRAPPLSMNEVVGIAKSVAKFIWTKNTPQSWIEWCSRRGVAGMKSRWGDNEDKVASARIMLAKGMSLRATARELKVHHETIRRWGVA